MTKTNQKIPEGWSIKKLGECFSFLRTSNYSRAETTDYGEVHYIHYGDIHTKYPLHISPKNIDIYVSTEQASKSDCLKTGDLILLDASEDYEGTTKCVELLNISDDEKVVSGLHTLALRDIFKNFINGFRAYITSIPFVKNNFWKQVTGIKVYGISKDNLKKIKIPVPPLPEQEKIAEILGTWDLAIEKLTALIEQKKLLKKGLMQRLLNFKKEYLKRFDEIFEDYSDKKHSDKDLLSATQENGVIPRRLLKGRVMSPEGSLDGYKLVQSGSFVISLRSFQGGLEYSDYEGIISPAYTVLKDKISINKCFYRYFFKSYNFIEKYLSIAVIGIRDGKQISYPDLQSVKIPYPPLSEQKAIADILSKADEEIDLLTAKLSALKSQKKGLMQKLLTGQIRVKVV